MRHIRLRSKSINLSGIDHVGGDMFVSVPKGDAVVLQVSAKQWFKVLTSRILLPSSQ